MAKKFLACALSAVMLIGSCIASPVSAEEVGQSASGVSASIPRSKMTRVYVDSQNSAESKRRIDAYVNSVNRGKKPGSSGYVSARRLTVVRGSEFIGGKQYYYFAGDIDGDQLITDIDADLMYKMLYDKPVGYSYDRYANDTNVANIRVFTDNRIDYRYDVNGDGSVDTKDYEAIYSYAKKGISGRTGYVGHPITETTKGWQVTQNGSCLKKSTYSVTQSVYTGVICGNKWYNV